MYRRLLAVATALAALAASAAIAGAAARPYRLEDVATFRTIGEIAVSPDGRRAAFRLRAADLTKARYATELWVVPTDGSSPARRWSDAGGRVSSPLWSPDGTLLACLVEDVDSSQVRAFSAEGGESRALTSHPEPVSAFEWAPDGKRLLFLAGAPETELENRRRKEKDDGALLEERWRNERLWIQSVEGGAAVPRTDGREHVLAAAWSADGSSIALLVRPSPEDDSDEETRALVLEADSGRLLEVPGSQRASSISWSRKGKTLGFVRPFDGKGISRQDLFLWEPGGAAPPRNVSAPVDRDIEGVRWDAGGRSVELTYSRGAATEVARIELPAGRPTRVWAPGVPVAAAGTVGSRRLFVPGDRPAELWIADAGGGRERRLTEINPTAAEIELPRIEVVRWKGPTGEVEGVLTSFPLETPAPRPLVVRPHGGPRLHSQAFFDPQIAYLASRGFLVLQPNFRGSTGYGDAFTRSNVGDWGDGPLEDSLAGVDALVSRGLADSRRVFLYGWSYGGYLANWAITRTDRFRAVASGAGVADFRLQYTTSDARRWRFDYFGGSPFLGHQELYDKLSPITRVRGVTTPALFLHGERDVRCPLSQSLMMYRALSDLGVPTGLLLFPREGHDFSEPRHVLDRIRRVAEWFERHDSARPGG